MTDYITTTKLRELGRGKEGGRLGKHLKKEEGGLRQLRMKTRRRRKGTWDGDGDMGREANNEGNLAERGYGE